MKVPNKVEQREAMARQIRKELVELRRARRNLGQLPLKKPLRYGWYKHLVLREDIVRRADAEVFQEILEACSGSVWGRDKAMADQEWERQESENGDWQWAGMTWITKRKYQRLSPRARKHFVELVWKWTPWQGIIKKYYCLVPRYYYIAVYEKAYVTHLQVVDHELDSRIAHLEQRMFGQHLFSYSWKAQDGWPNKWWRQTCHRRDRRKSKANLRQYDEENYIRRMGRSVERY